jgi:hypothetical protein
VGGGEDLSIMELAALIGEIAGWRARASLKADLRKVYDWFAQREARA